jgi:hypothetical protein
MVYVPCDYAKNILPVLLKMIHPKFVNYKQHDDETARKSYGESKDVDEGDTSVPY